MDINSNEILMQIGWENDDFLKFKHTIICDYKNLRVKFKISDDPKSVIDDALKTRLVVFKAMKRFKKALSIYPLGGYIRYALE